MIEYFLNPKFVEALGWTLLHSLWQGAIFAILLGVIFIALRSYSAQSRYVVATGLLLAFFVTAGATFWMQWQDATSPLELATAASNSPQKNDVLNLEINTSTNLQLDIEATNTPPTNSELLVASQSSDWVKTFSNYYDRHLPLLVTIWLLGVLFLQLRFLGQLAYVQRLKHYGTQLFPQAWSNRIEELEAKLRIQKKVSYLTSIRTESPMVIGWLKPVVLLPRQLLQSLSETEIYAVLAHELAHIRREDFVVNLMQTLLCNVFFFHPGVWWMSNRVDDEREHCCDDLAVAVTGQAVSYAKTLINVSELQLTMEGTPTLAMALSGKGKKRERGGFTGRIRRLFMVQNGASTFREGFATACILFTALLVGIAATGQTVQTAAPQDSSEIEKSKNLPTENQLTGSQLTDNLLDNEIIASDEPDTSKKVNRFGIEGERLSFRTEPPASPEDPEPPESPSQKAATRIDALVMACAEGDIDFVQTLIKAGIDINGIGSEGFTPLMTASSENKVHIVEYLINNGADVNQISEGWTALLEAADEGSLESMKLLLDSGADVDYFTAFYGPAAITMAASEGHLDCLKLLLEHKADINGVGNSLPPLHIAAEEDKREIIKYLISQNVDIDNKDASGRTALMYAASEGHEQVVKMLMEAGADKSIVDLEGATAKDYAEEEDEYGASDYLRSGQRPDIHQATLDGKIEKVQRMVKQGMDVNTRDDFGRTPLHIASAENHNIDMRVLINLGADIDAQDSQGRTPMMYAAEDGKRDAVVLLVSHVADVNIQDADGMRALEWSHVGDNVDLINFLGLITESKAKAKTDSNQYDKDTKENITEEQYLNSFQDRIDKIVEREVRKVLQKEEQKEVEKNVEKEESVHVAKDGLHIRQFDMEKEGTELMHAAKNGSIEDCRRLIANGAKVNATDDTGQTALMGASFSNRISIARFLIENGADVNMSSASGMTALHYATLANHLHFVRFLLENNAKVDATMDYSSSDGNTTKELLACEYINATPLLIAVEANNAKLVNAFITAGANPDHRLTKIEYRLKKGSKSYLGLSEVIGIDDTFRKDAEVKVSDDSWTPQKQAIYMNNPTILTLFSK